MMTSRGPNLHERPRPRRPLLALWASLWVVEVLLGPVSPAWAQRRRGEPEANPDFQGPAQGGAQQPGADQGAQAGDAGAAAGGAEPLADPGGGGRPGVQGVQIGANTPPPPPPAPTSPLETRVTVRVKDAPLATFLDTISAQAKVNFIITEGVTQRKVTAFLQNVTVREALQILLEIKGLTYQQIGKSNTYVVSPRSATAPNQITRIYILNHVPLIPLLGQDDGVGGGAAAAGGGGGAAPAGGGGGGGGGGAQSKIAIINVINSLLSKSGRVSVDARTNSVIVTDIPEIFPQVEQIIAELDKKVPQVMIEAQIVEINSERLNKLGISWTNPTGDIITWAGGTRSTTFPFNLPKNLANMHFFSDGKHAGADGTPGAGGALFAGAPDVATTVSAVTNSLEVILQAIVTRSEGRLLGKPKILTLNNKKATIEISQKETTHIEKGAGGQAGGQFQTQTPVKADTGVTLEVTPQVNKENYITLLVEPKFIDANTTKYTVDDQPVKDTVTRKASTLLRLRSGQTVVLGGMLKSVEQRTVKKVPFLGYIPLLGWLFTSTSTERQNKDLVIFLTPTVVTD